MKPRGGQAPKTAGKQDSGAAPPRIKRPKESESGELITPRGVGGSIGSSSALWILGGWLLVLAAARGIQWFPNLLPPCGLRTLTGLPCPFCGGTRALIAWSRLDFAQAFACNPLVGLGCIAVCAWFFVWMVDHWRGGDWNVRTARRLQKKPWPAILIGAALANWIYLLLWLPK